MFLKKISANYLIPKVQVSIDLLGSLKKFTLEDFIFTFWTHPNPVAASD